ncbi:MAG TPA: hypothetical protein VFP50_09530 [Anaeromyxobacteraceae bacterium]|jgi:hypothetical protein|nr:hypothetical protein [Anaeromyxobacteraceae bacterium]
MPLALALGTVTLAALAALAGAWRRREQARDGELEALRARLDELAARLDLAEQDAAEASAQAAVAEGLFLEKGIADPDEVEDLRRRLGGEGGTSRDGTDALH